MSDNVKIQVELNEATAWALAQFVKRVGWVEFKNNAVDDNEARKIREGINAVQDALNDQGICPR